MSRREISQLNNAIETVVVSLTTDEPWCLAGNDRIVGRSDAVAELRRLMERDGCDIVAFGSSTARNASSRPA
jgi:hypothetical protein